MKNNNKPGFVEFSLNKSWRCWRADFALPVICFSAQKFTPNALEIIGDKMPVTWLRGYSWRDLNIMPEAYLDRHDGNSMDLRRLMVFIRAFGFSPNSKLYMDIWKERLSKDIYND